MNADLEQCRITAHYIPHWSDDCCFELRALGVWDPIRDPEKQFQKKVSGYYDDPEAMARDAVRLSGRSSGVYLLPNPVRRDLICRSKNQLKWWVKNASKDEDVMRRRWLLIDFDPINDEDVSSTDAEHEAAMERAIEVKEELHRRGAKGIVFASSGNGAHLLVPMDEPNNATAKLKCERVLKRLGEQFTDKKVLVDPTTFNASRLIRFYGTMTCKGSNCPEEGRPHRISRILDYDPTENVDDKR